MKRERSGREAEASKDLRATAIGVGGSRSSA